MAHQMADAGPSVTTSSPKPKAVATYPATSRRYAVAVMDGRRERKEMDNKGRKEACENCKYWVKQEKGECGHCHRWPPTECFENSPHFHIFVRGDDWCGEFKMKVMKGEYPKRPYIQNRIPYK